MRSGSGAVRGGARGGDGSIEKRRRGQMDGEGRGQVRERKGVREGTSIEN